MTTSQRAALDAVIGIAAAGGHVKALWAFLRGMAKRENSTRERLLAEHLGQIFDFDLEGPTWRTLNAGSARTATGPKHCL
jgi:hypothetical protein